MSKMAHFPSLGLLFIYLLTIPAKAQQSPAPNSDPTYQQLKNVSLREAVEVKDLTLKRDAGTFHLRSGSVCFLAPVSGKVTGAVFTGDGVFTIEPMLSFLCSSVRPV